MGVLFSIETYEGKGKLRKQLRREKQRNQSKKKKRITKRGRRTKRATPQTHISKKKKTRQWNQQHHSCQKQQNWSGKHARHTPAMRTPSHTHSHKKANKKFDAC